jgi:hypothetical protein
MDGRLIEAKLTSAVSPISYLVQIIFEDVRGDLDLGDLQQQQMKTDTKYANQAKLIVGQKAVTDDEKTERHERISAGPSPAEIERKTHDDEADYIAARPWAAVGMKRMIGSRDFLRINHPTVRGLPTGFGDSGERATKAARKPERRKPKKIASRPVDKAAERRPLSPTNGSRKIAIANGRRPGRKSVNAGNRPSTRRKRRLMMPSASTQRRPRRSRPRPTMLRKERKPNVPATKKRNCG